MKNTTFIVLVLTVCFLQASFLPAQTPTATKTDSIIHDAGTTDKADPGDTIRYKVTIDNSTGASSSNVQLKTGIDSLSTFVSGSFRTSPLAVNDTFEVTGNVGINVPAVNGLLPNDFDDNTGGLAVVAEMKATTQGGSVTINTNGSFTYTPPAGFSGTDDFTYTLSDGNTVGGSVPSTDEGTVILNVSNVIWFINNTGGGSGGTGTLANPFKTLADFNVSMGPAVGHLIFIEETGTSYNGGIVLKNNQILFGEGHTGGANLADALPFMLAPHSIALPAINGTFPVITNTGGNGVTLAQNNTLNGFTAGNSSGSAMTGTGFGTLTVNNVVINSTGQALSLLNGTVAGSGFNSVTSAGGTNNISLGSLSGTLALGGGALIGATGASFFNDQGTAIISYNGTISKATGNRLIDIQNKTGGSITFGGALTHSNVTGQEAVRLDSNTGSTINFTGGVNITSSSTSAAFSATGGGTVNVTGVANVINSASSTALNVQNTTIGASGLTFQSLSSGNNTAAADPANGIVLNNTGTLGGLTVTGSGSVNSGGIIQNTTGDGISLISTSMASFDRLRVQDTGGDGISGSEVHGFTLTNSTVFGAGDGDEENGIVFGNSFPAAGPITNLGIDGTVLIQDVLIDGNSNGTQFGLRIYNNTDGATLNMTLQRLTIQHNIDTGPWVFGEDAASIEIYDGTANILIDDCDFLNTEGKGVHANAGDGSPGEGALMNLTVQNCTFNNNHALPSAMSFSTSGDATGRFKATGNMITGPTIAGVGSMGIDLDAAIDSNLDAIVANNTMDITFGTGLEFVVNESAIGRLQATNNIINLDPGNINGASQQGMNFQAREVLAPWTGGQLHLTLTSNTVNGITSGIFGFQGINFQSGSSGSAPDDETILLNMTGNAVNGSPGLTAYSFRQRTGTTFQIQGLTPASGASEMQVESHIQTNNSGGNLGGLTEVASASGTTIVSYMAGIPQIPTTPTLP